MNQPLAKALSAFDGVDDVEIDECVIDKDDGGVFPAVISIQFAPTADGFHALEFIVWALGDIRKAGADVHYHLSASPPWLNTPGQALSFAAYVNPRSTDATEADQVAEVQQEMADIASFFNETHSSYWALCRANV